jgi:alpha-1,2-mannosyltransferase
VTSATRRLLVFAVANFALTNALMLALRVPPRDTDLHPLAWFLSFRQGGDSWRPMNQAYDFATTPEGRGKTLYEKMFFSPAVKHKGFQYPPTSLLAIAASRVFGEAHGLRVLEAVTWLFIPATAFFCHRIYSARGGPPRDALALALLVLFVTLSFYPAMRAYRNGQIQAWINGLFAASLFAYVRERRGLAGALAGAMCLIKPQYALLALWGLLRREWAFLRGALAVGALGLLASLALFGVSPHLQYLDVLRFIAERGESFYPNQSLNGLLNRALGNGQNLTWMDAMPEPHPVVRTLTWLSSAALLAWALWPRRRSNRSEAGQADLSMIAVACTVASPIAWEHHYGLLLPVFALLLPALRREPVLGRATLPLLAGAFVLTGHTLRATDALADTPWNFLQSYILAGALLLLLLLDRLRAHIGAARPAEP